MPEIQPIRITVADLQNLVAICENEIRLIEFSNIVFGVNGATQMRAIASNLQARFEQELARQAQISDAAAVEAERKKSEAAKKVDPVPEPVKG